jgi:hypothetical protein
MEMGKRRKPSKVKVTRLDDGRIEVLYDAPIKVRDMDFWLMGYRRENEFLANGDGYCVGFRLHIKEYRDMMTQRLGLRFKKGDVQPTPWATKKDGRVKP